jgi:alkaline phosphatase D
MTIDRRSFLRGAVGIAAGALLPTGCRTARAAPAGNPVFAHGVASGDPLSDRVILWTRVTAPPGAGGPVAVRWQLASDPAFASVVAQGRAVAGAERDFTVKLDAMGLQPGGTWFYRFDALGERSPVGRTRTLPTGAAPRARFAVCSCSNLPEGYFNAYAAMAQRDDLEAVLHLGDYLYEYGRDGYGGDAGLGRDVIPAHEILTLGDYRTRYAQYRSDADLQAVHGAHPFIAVWDDHEIANDSWRDGAENHQPATEGQFATRRAAAIRAYFEWMPIRTLPGDLRAGRIHRSFRYGDLVDLVMLDTRLLGRDRHAAREDVAALEDPRRTLLGAEQEAWLAAELERSQSDGTAWRVLGQQVMLAPMVAPGEPSHNDTWDGYRAARSRLLDHFGSAGIRDVVALTGDYHSSWAMDVCAEPFSERAYDPATGRGAQAVEFVAPAVSAAPLGRIGPVSDPIRRIPETHPHVRMNDVDRNGYFVLDLDRDRAQADWFFEQDVREPGSRQRFGAGFATERGRSHLVAQTAPVSTTGGS